PAQPDLQAGHLQAERAPHSTNPLLRSSISAASSGGRSTPIATRANASVNVFVPTVSSATSRTGTMTAHGFSDSPLRVSLITVPQLVAGGGCPKPRNASPAMITIE